MIAFRNFFFRPRPAPRIRLSQPGIFVLFRGAPSERIEATFDESGQRLLKLVVFTRR